MAYSDPILQECSGISTPHPWGAGAKHSFAVSFSLEAQRIEILPGEGAKTPPRGDKTCLVTSDGATSWGLLPLQPHPPQRTPLKSTPSHPCPAGEKHLAQISAIPLPPWVLCCPFLLQNPFLGTSCGQSPAAPGVPMAQFQGKLLCWELGQAREDTQVMLALLPPTSSPPRKGVFNSERGEGPARFRSQPLE